ncbi:MAG: 5-formyltetrahydrofolate cyclo-ligase [Candidatus Zixiibacteriota bacterium]|nr:MAG: 5-formyltetrahydrofolate cyclo-ligase [candidate division Zixibacteria bacterium]
MVNPEDDIAPEKERLRNEIWTLLEQRNVVIFPLPVRGRIPNFIGSDEAAGLVRTLPEWKRARVIFANPDSPQKKIREFALKDGKILIMASPRLKHGFLQIDPQDVKGKEEAASSIKGAFKYGKPAKDMPRPDVIITSCVAVDHSGWRLGKGGGYGDIEVKKIKDEFGEIPVVTTVHSLQLVESVPHAKHDARVDVIVTPDRIYRIPDATGISVDFP